MSAAISRGTWICLHMTSHGRWIPYFGMFSLEKMTQSWFTYYEFFRGRERPGVKDIFRAAGEKSQCLRVYLWKKTIFTLRVLRRGYYTHHYFPCFRLSRENHWRRSRWNHGRKEVKGTFETLFLLGLVLIMPIRNFRIFLYFCEKKKFQNTFIFIWFSDWIRLRNMQTAFGTTSIFF